MKCIKTAYQVGINLDGKVHIGFRPFNDEDELLRWFPGTLDLTESPLNQTPIWILIENGNVQDIRIGFLQQEEVSEFTRKGFQLKGR